VTAAHHAADPVAAPAPAELAATADRLRAAAAPLARMSLEERIAAIDRAAATWLDHDSERRRLGIAQVAAASGYPAASVAMAIDHLWEALRARELSAVVATEMPLTAGIAPAALALHVLAGNVPGAGVFGIIAALLAGTPSIVKTSRREPRLPALIAETLASEDPRLGAALAVAHWPGGSALHDSVALGHADLVLAYGREATLDGIAAHRPARLLRFGPRLSAALIAADACDRAIADVAAAEVALFDQQGCLSPQLLVVEDGGAAAIGRFVEALLAALARLAITLPRAPLSLAEAAAAWRFLARQRWRAQEGAAVEVHADPQAQFSVVCDRSGATPASPLNRHVVLVPVPSLRAAAGVLARFEGSVEAVGYAGPERRLDEAAAVAVASGAHRLCPLERMQRPPFAWRQSGHARIASFFASPPLPSAVTTGTGSPVSETGTDAPCALAPSSGWETGHTP